MNDIDEMRRLLEQQRKIMEQKRENAELSAQWRERFREVVEKRDDTTEVDKLIAERLFGLEQTVELFERNFDIFAERIMSNMLAAMEQAQGQGKGDS